MQEQVNVIVMVIAFMDILITLFLTQDLMRNNMSNIDIGELMMHGLYHTVLNCFLYGKVTSILKLFSLLMSSFTYTTTSSKELCSLNTALHTPGNQIKDAIDDHIQGQWLLLLKQHTTYLHLT